MLIYTSSLTIGNCTCCSDCDDGAVRAAAALGVLLFLETVLVGVVIGLIIWKRITVAKYLYNLQLPKMREIPQVVIRKFRPSSSTPPPELAIHIHMMLYYNSTNLSIHNYISFS